jgi:hypothetical protein
VASTREKIEQLKEVYGMEYGAEASWRGRDRWNERS